MWSKKFSGLINPTGGKYIGPIPAMTASNHRHFLLFKLFFNCYLLSSQVISEETNTLNAPFPEFTFDAKSFDTSRLQIFRWKPISTPCSQLVSQIQSGKDKKAKFIFQPFIKFNSNFQQKADIV